MALNLQTSFLTPPFGFALFYLRGVSPPKSQHRTFIAGFALYRHSTGPDRAIDCLRFWRQDLVN